MEYIRVKNGRARVVLNGKARIVTSEDGPQEVRKGVVHEFMRADRGAMGPDGDEGDLVVEEWTDPCMLFNF